jgi:putative CocE/NonD family hydrolase
MPVRFALVAVFACYAAAAENYDFAAHYTKFEYRIPMRDGVHLFTAVYVPRDGSKAYPFLITRTPYSVAPYGANAYPKISGGVLAKFAEEGYTLVLQDVRGRFMSEGEFVEMRPERNVHSAGNDTDESTDTFDSIDWLLKNVPNNNGRAGLLGTSYPGFFADAALINSHPALKAVSPQAPVADLYMGDDAYHNGAFYLLANFGFYAFFGPQHNPTGAIDYKQFDYGTENGYQFFLHMGALANADREYFHYANHYWTDIVRHTTYDNFWQVRNVLPHLIDVKPAVLMVGGWFDAEDLSGPLQSFRAIAAQSPATTEHLVMGPWTHGEWNRSTAKTIFFQDSILLPFFRHYLKEASDPQLPLAYNFETGKNVWVKHDHWPPANVTKELLYLQAQRKLAFQLPAVNDKKFDEYVSDPANPVPFFSKPTVEMERSYMSADQRFVSTRPDVLSYQTDALDRDMTVAGPVSPSLFVSSSGTDSDFVVKFIDVLPAGEQLLIRGEPFRGKFRNSFERPEPFTPGDIQQIRFSMPDVYHCFQKGHRIMLQIQSSWFPLVDRNPQTFTDIPNAKDADFVKATERIYHAPDAASSIEMDVMPNGR